jgi:catechol 2,3-dioxygenase-like lactoylglutathione lyase family enzyme
MSELISGIQQIGIGVTDAPATFKWYNQNLDLNVKVFDDAAEAPLMLPYTQGEVRSRHAIMAISMAGGGGAEIWQYTSRVPVAADFQIQLGDLGTYSTKIKSLDIKKLHEKLTAKQLDVTQIAQTPEGKSTFWLTDNTGNKVQLIEGNTWFRPENEILNGGMAGAVIGVSDVEASMKFYKDTLKIDEVVYDVTGEFTDLQLVQPNVKKFRRVLLRKATSTSAPFGKLLGGVEIELVQAFDYQPKKIFAGRDWGDRGYIHICFDTAKMNELKISCAENGFPFTVDSADTFDMGQAGGRFSYTEDPDGTLIEFVEAHRVPIIKKIGWYMNLKNRKKQTNLPDWMVATLGWNKVKF